jgi:hypothetical protein
VVPLSKIEQSMSGAGRWRARARTIGRAVGRSVGRLLPWLPFAIVAAGGIVALVALLNIASIRGELLFHTPTAAVVLQPGAIGGAVASTPGGGVDPAQLDVGIFSFDAATQTTSVRVTLGFTDTLVTHLRLAGVSDRTLVPLAAVPYKVWAHLPVGIQITQCGYFITAVGTCGASQVTIPLGQLVTYSGAGAASRASNVPAPVALSVFGWPNRFPSDTYQFVTFPQITLPDRVVLATSAAGGFENHRSVVPTTVALFGDPGLGDHTLTLYKGMSGHHLFIDLIIGRPLAYRVTVYAVALLPLLLGVVVVHASARLTATKRTSGPVFDLGVIAGLIAAMLAILPLRAVLVPTDLNVAGLTLLDYILVLDVLFIAAFVFFQYARFVTKPRVPDQMSSAEDIEKKPK